MKKLKIVFAGTPEFARVHLEKLLSSNHEVIAVYTQPDKPAGRGRKHKKSAVKDYAITRQLAVYQPSSLKNETALTELKKLQPDVIIVVAYGVILPQAVLDIPKLGCINVHGSLLPKWRGAAPIQRAIEAGDNNTGITIMQMDAGLDTGDMLLKSSCAIHEDDTTTTLQYKLADIGSNLLITAVEKLANNNLVAEKQDNSLATYAHKITKEEAKIDFQLSAVTITRKLRAFTPQLGLNCIIKGIQVKIWEALAITPVTENHHTGSIVAANKQGIDFACNNSLLRATTLQLPGGRKMSSADILNGNKELFAVGNIAN